MTPQDAPDPFGRALRKALSEAGWNQAKLARNLDTNEAQVSRWTNGHTVPNPSTVSRIEGLLNVSLSEALARSTPSYELYVSAPLTGLHDNDVVEHHDAVNAVVTAARIEVRGVFWPAEAAKNRGELRAANLATEKNLKVLAGCEAFLYLQFSEIVQPSGALIELGLALGRRCKTTLIIRRGLKWPYMLHQFPVVAGALNFLPKALTYEVDSVEEGVDLVERNGRELFGLS